MSGEIPSDCVYDVWGADYGVEAGARCLNTDPAHQQAHHASPALWRFDVPEVPASVMAFKDRDGKVWCRMHRNQWCLYPVEQYQAKPFSFVLAYAPLAECEDPRSTR